MDPIKAISCIPYQLPMKSPFVTSLGRKKSSANLWVRLELESGITGWGEASSSLAFPSQTPQKMKPWLLKVTRPLLGRNIEIFQKKIRTHKPILPKPWPYPAALGALECALLEAVLIKKNLNPINFFGGSKKAIQNDITLSLQNSRQSLRLARYYFNRGFRRFKLKISGRTWDQNLKRIEILSTQFPSIKIILDGNQGFSVSQAENLICICRENKWPIYGFEQPTPKNDIGALKYLRKISAIPIYADEAASSLTKVKKLIKRKAVDGIVVKIAKTGLLEAMQISQWARKHQIKTLISCMAESSRGLAMSIYWAIGDGGFDWVDLDSYLLTKSRYSKDLFRTQGPWIRPPMKYPKLHFSI